MLKIDLTKEDIPGAADTVGAALLFANTIPTAASLVLSLLSHGLDARDAIEAPRDDELDEGNKKGKKEVGRAYEHHLRDHRICEPSCLTSSLEFHLGRLTKCVSA